MAKVRKCIVDKTAYEYCPHCPSKFDPTQTWRINFCSENCRAVFNACNDFVAGDITREEAIEKLDALDLSNMDNYSDSITKNVKDILGVVEEEEDKNE